MIVHERSGSRQDCNVPRQVSVILWYYMYFLVVPVDP